MPGEERGLMGIGLIVVFLIATLRSLKRGDVKAMSDDEADVLFREQIEQDAIEAAKARAWWADRIAVGWWFTMWLAGGLLALYGLVRFIKWAWTD